MIGTRTSGPGSSELRDGVREEYEDAVQRMVLFGSKVRGDWHTSSDVDVVVIVHDAATAKEREIMRLGAKLAATRKVAPGVMAQTESEWARLGAAMMNIHAEVERQGGVDPVKTRPLARDKWRSATEALKEANVLTREGLYKGAISRDLRRDGERRARGTGIEGARTENFHAGLGEAFKNHLIRSGAMDKKWSEALGAASVGAQRRRLRRILRRPAQTTRRTSAPRRTSS